MSLSIIVRVAQVKDTDKERLPEFFVPSAFLPVNFYL